MSPLSTGVTGALAPAAPFTATVGRRQLAAVPEVCLLLSGACWPLGPVSQGGRDESH